MSETITAVLKRYGIKNGFELNFVLSQSDADKNLGYARAMREEMDIEQQAFRPAPASGQGLAL